MAADGARVGVGFGLGVGLGVGMMVVAGRSFFIGQSSASAQCPAAGLRANRQLKHFGGHEQRRMPCLPRQLKPE
jgi:hypothetical protein